MHPHSYFIIFLVPYTVKIFSSFTPKVIKISAVSTYRHSYSVASIFYYYDVFRGEKPERQGIKKESVNILKAKFILKYKFILILTHFISVKVYHVLNLMLTREIEAAGNSKETCVEFDVNERN